MSVPPGPHTATSHSATRHDDAGFDRASWAVLAFAVLFLAITALVAWHRLTLPDDGSGLYLDSGNRAGFTTDTGRTIVAVEGQPAADILLRALTLRPSPPGNWAVGHQVVYTHPSGDQVVVLQRRTAGFENNPARNIVISAVFLAIALFAFVRRPRNRAARLLLLFPVMLIANEIAVIPSDGWAAVSLADLFSPFAYWPAEFYNQFLHV
ncbi:MAG TPA: hypothetical protein VFT99_20490, partial [Roseiflexaceae bacterium]|nr:hypothetical protein [Roseiflexaceae bacterium]